MSTHPTTAEHATGARLHRAGLDIGAELVQFAEETLLAAGEDVDRFWKGVADILEDLTPTNRALLAERDRLQVAIDEFHRTSPGLPDPAEYRAFLERIGYLVPEPEPFHISTDDIDPEIALSAGPQLVVPLLNARYALNAANARWGSLYDALYGTDAIPFDLDRAAEPGYDPQRGAEVIAFARGVLDEVAPLESGSHTQSSGYRVHEGRLIVAGPDGESGLADPTGFIGYAGTAEEPTAVLLRHHGLHVEIAIDRGGRIGSGDPAGIDDILLESALTTIMDLEDSVAAVDAADKAIGYRNWRQLMDGSLTASVSKGGRSFERRLHDDRRYTGPDGTDVVVRGRSLLIVRNVGHLMTTDAVRDETGAEVPEGILDAIMTALGSLAELRSPGRYANSASGSLYIVKPKMHGPEEVGFTVELFGRVEALLGLPARTLKVGIMDEERRMTLNLRASIRAASDRVVFINTGFLDRTGDDIHTSLHAGPMVPKDRMRTQPFLVAYEQANVDAGLATGFAGHAQIGKGMWAMPDLMHDMLEQKVAHVRSGASTAWVPSPTAATLHALHYHQVNVREVQEEVSRREPKGLADVLIPPLLEGTLSAEEIQQELDNDVQSILGYVVRWVDQGVGCSKVPDIHGVSLMEDRATLRISSQLLSNWLMHGLITQSQLDDSMRRLSVVVDEQNAGDAAYEPLIGANGPGIAFESARRLIVEGAAQPSGYTEPILHEMRRRKKREIAAADAR